jgi:hypothetical protein
MTTELFTTRPAPLLMLAGLVLLGMLSVVLIEGDGWSAADANNHITTEMAAAAIGARVTPTDPRL